MTEVKEAHCFLCFGERAETESGDQFWECSICSCRVHLECQRKYDTVRPGKPTGARWQPVLCPYKHPLKRELQVRAPVDWRGDWQWQMHTSWKMFTLVMVLIVPLNSLWHWSNIKVAGSYVTWMVKTIIIHVAPVYYSPRSIDIALLLFEAGMNVIYLLIWFFLLFVTLWRTLHACFSFTIPRPVLYTWIK